MKVYSEGCSSQDFVREPKISQPPQPAFKVVCPCTRHVMKSGFQCSKASLPAPEMILDMCPSSSSSAVPFDPLLDFFGTCEFSEATFCLAASKIERLGEKRFLQSNFSSIVEVKGACAWKLRAEGCSEGRTIEALHVYSGASEIGSSQDRTT